MALFSERYGYTKPSDIIIRERLTPEIENAICNFFDALEGAAGFIYTELEKYLWVYFFHRRNADYRPPFYQLSDDIGSPKLKWFRKLDLIEVTLEYLGRLMHSQKYRGSNITDMTSRAVHFLNTQFERLHFGYHIVDGKIVEISSEQEINTIETALRESPSNVQMHLSKALELYAKRPEADYSNSIKESISAVEAYCREQTETQTLGEALKALSSRGINIPPMLKTSFEKLYAYTNGPLGIRHALMTTNEQEAFIPGAEEALFMLVSCSSFLSYLYKKSTKASIESNRDK